jgi:RNA recognition motif-containing protein
LLLEQPAISPVFYLCRVLALFMIKLFVVGFPREMNEVQLTALFAPYGDVDLLTIVRDQFSGVSKGFGFVHMKDEQGAGSAIRALNGMVLGDRTLEVRTAEDKPAPVKPGFQPRQTSQTMQPATSGTIKKKRPRIGK